MRARKKRAYVLVFALSVILLFSGCSNTADDTTQTEKVPTEEAKIEITHDDYEISTDGMTIKGNENEVQYESDDGAIVYEIDLVNDADLPEDYPSNIVPIYPNGRITLAGKQDTGFIVAIVTDDSISDVYDYYKENIALDIVMGEQNTAEMAMIIGTANGMNVSLTVTVNSLYEGGENLIAVSIGE